MAVLNLLPFGATWSELLDRDPGFGSRVKQRFEKFPQHIMATLSHDGSPRVSGTQVYWVDSRLVLLVTSGTVKANDLDRDPRVAIHSNPGDGSMSEGDYKINGRVMELRGQERERVESLIPIPGGPQVYEVRIFRIACTTVVDGQRDIHLWTPTGLRRIEKTD